MELIVVDGARIEVARIAGPSGLAPIVFLHEGLGSVAMWRDWPTEVCKATDRAGVVYSRRGYGQSQGIDDVRGAGRLKPDYMHQEAWSVLPALLEELDIEKPVLLGHSDGATIALLFASSHPVAACIALAPHVMVEDVSIRSIEQARTAYESTDLKSRLARYHADPECAFRQWNDVWLSEAFRDFDIRPECGRIAAPLLAIQGIDDEYGTMQQIEDIARVAPHAVTLAVTRCGHSPHRDQPEQVTQAITAFLRNLP